METPAPCVLVVGCAAVGKKTLISRITGSRSDQQVLWTIDTKYYTAQAQILSVNIPPNNSHDSSAQDCESLILIFDAQREETFRQAKEWLIQQSVSPEITLLVANKSELLRGPDGAVQRQTWHEEAQDWCCEQLFEYIEVSAADDAADHSLQLDGDPQGLKRVLEALEAHTWPGLHLKAYRNGSSNGNGLGVHAANVSQLPGSEGPGPTSDPENSHKQYWTNHAQEEHQQSSMQEPHSGPALDDLGARATLVPSAGEAESTNGSSMNGQNGIAKLAGSQSEEDAELENFEVMLGRLSEARGQVQEIPDDERRARAATFAMQMLESLGLDDDDDSDDGDGNDDSFN